MKFQLQKDIPSMLFQKHRKFGVGSGHVAMALRVDYIKQLQFVLQNISEVTQ